MTMERVQRRYKWQIIAHPNATHLLRLFERWHSKLFESMDCFEHLGSGHILIVQIFLGDWDSSEFFVGGIRLLQDFCKKVLPPPKD